MRTLYSDLKIHLIKNEKKRHWESSPYDGPVVLKKDWEKKRWYIQAVTNHMNEKPGAIQDVMFELLTLISHVGDNNMPSNGKQWQHPADFTRRNYQVRFGNSKPTTTLSEWQAKNQGTYKRFSHVPKIFDRSPLKFES